MSNGDAANYWRAIEEEKLRKRIAELEADLEIANDSRAIVDKALHERRVQVEALLAENQRLRKHLENISAMNQFDHDLYAAKAEANKALLGGGEK